MTMSERASSESVEMYLKSVAELGGERKPVSLAQIAARLGVSVVSTSEMMKRLGDQNLVHHEPYKGVTLTRGGQRLANSVIRRQRLWECFLVEHLHLDWAKAHDMACDLEHATAPEVTEALDAYLDFPTRCPHGNLIPDPAGEVEYTADVTLASLTLGKSGRIQAIAPETSEVLAYLAERDLRPGRIVTVVDAAPLQGPLTLQVRAQAGAGALDSADAPAAAGAPVTADAVAVEVILGLNLAELVLVEELGGELG
jgi:DtxR family Mn-dependent transcriptional regulator